MNDDDDVVTVLFDTAGYRTLSKQLLTDPTAGATLQDAADATARHSASALAAPRGPAAGVTRRTCG